ncbi:TauD/TfdA family dioxygenase [Streptomyces mobaraensis NBRC 13819 = DSM 40847]|uniref:SyrP protein n=2 Tax=Streptomyces TaxID=1883 RepID=M3BM04_STRM1|nr:TauD/TfdA family dioxygenase [Streptomyces mobaraensis]AAG02342.1 SyrP-like protein [Streptomyces verticillus]EMF00650.1 SyrP protein [Streptomyces mobaraensis NBRC 13819 = DSM 40847]QTT72112.1 TauD/TfdA family dioxygenase [Streptomyces mobaraensis NBRC 13819 = DSM 40847]
MTGSVTLTPLGGIIPRPRGEGLTTGAEYDLGPLGDAGPDWVRAHGPRLRERLATDGLILLHGLPTDGDGVDGFHDVVGSVGGDPLPYTERSTPRSVVKGNIYTSTEYPADQPIPMHNENSYAAHWPSTLYFFCHTAPDTGGATPIADGRAVLDLIPAEVRRRFSQGVVYTRTFRADMGLSWQEAFQTEDRGDVERHCRAHGQEFSWDGDVLRTRHHRPATAVDPGTGAEVWFNQAHLFHPSSLDPDLRQVLLETYGENGLPRDALFADGTPIPDADLATVRAAYTRAALALPWREGDIMLVDNLRMAHGREPFTGERRVLVAMTSADS